MQLAVVAHPNGRRVQYFYRAVQAAGLPAPTVVSWRTVLTEGALYLAGHSVRIDSPGEDPEVDRLLRGADTVAPQGSITSGRCWYAGLVAAVRRIGDVAERTWPAPQDIATLFDKSLTYTRLQQAGIDVPPALDKQPVNYADLRNLLARRRWHRVFVKPVHGSGGAGVLALHVDTHRAQAKTAIVTRDGAPYSSLRLRTVDDEEEIAGIVDMLAPDGLHVERWFPKAGIDGATTDLRAVTIGGRLSHVVVRRSNSPITNLHLGNQRGDVQRWREVAGDAAWKRLHELSEQVAHVFPECHQLGIDIMFGPGFRSAVVAEVNAFGDLLPGAMDVDGRGLDTYAAQVRDLMFWCA